jgi:rhodanese-related sulfurtransferase
MNQYRNGIALGQLSIKGTLSRSDPTLVESQLKLTLAKLHFEEHYMIHSEGFLKLVNDAKSRIREVTVEQTRQRIGTHSGVKLIDVREDNEWQEGHAAGADHLGKGIIERDIERTVPDKSTELILYCGGGYRSALVTDVLQKMGYTNVFSMAGGWKAWKESGAPTTS